MNYSLDKNGFEVFKLNNSLKKAVSNEIRKNISRKLNIKLNSSYSLISKNINLISDKQFKQLFGFVSLRYLSKELTNKINNYLKLNKLNKNFKKISLHYLSSKSDLIHNNDLKINQYCVYYRVVRKEKKDVSFPHRDSDFWKAHRYDKNLVPKVPFKYLKRFKVWFLFMVVKTKFASFFNFSHKHKISTRYVSKNGYKT